MAILIVTNCLHLLMTVTTHGMKKHLFFPGMTLTADDSDDDDETPESGSKDMDDMDDDNSFVETDENNIILSALY